MGWLVHEIGVVLVCAAAWVFAGPTYRPGTQPQEPSLADVLQRVGRYVDDYGRTFAVVVSREHYVQSVRSGGSVQSRELRSEVALVEAGRDAGWLLFRDVYEVDRRPVRDRIDRLSALFEKPPADLGVQARRISQEGARHNLGAVRRTINIPTLALLFLESRAQSRSTFRLEGRATIDGTQTLELRFEETATPRMVQTLDGAAARGKAWVEPESGAVVKTEFLLISSIGSAFMTTTYGRQPNLTVRAPIEMVERYEMNYGSASGVMGSVGVSARTRIEGRATYSDFRRFTVDTATIIR
jgi:hypothetical protein